MGSFVWMVLKFLRNWGFPSHFLQTFWQQKKNFLHLKQLPLNFTVSSCFFNQAGIMTTNPTMLHSRSLECSHEIPIWDYIGLMWHFLLGISMKSTSKLSFTWKIRGKNIILFREYAWLCSLMIFCGIWEFQVPQKFNKCELICCEQKL